MKYQSRVCDSNGEPEWVFIDRIDELRVDYSKFKKTHEEPKEIRIKRIGSDSYETGYIGDGAYLMGDDGKTIDKFYRDDKPIPLTKLHG